MDLHYTLSLYPILSVVIVAVFGLCFGSFATLVSHRLPLGEDILFGRSRCPKCKTALSLPDLFPVLSWLMSRGKCRHCGVRVSTRYIFIELATSTAFVITYLQYGPTLDTLVLCLLATCLVIIIVTDLEYTIIPDEIQIAMVVLGIFYQLLPEGSIAQIFIGPIIGVGAALFLRWSFSRTLGKESLGLGDVKFMAAVGIFLPEGAIITFLLVSGVIGIITSILWNASGKGKEFPFGPALALGLYFSLLLPDLQEHLAWAISRAIL